jgi:membrane protease YdiL (CAAX protease family)
MIETAALSTVPRTLTVPQRILSLVEFAIGATIVVAHNVFHAVPNEVPILFVLGILSIRLREGNWRAIGFARPKSWTLTIVAGVATAIAVIASSIFMVDPLIHVLGLHNAKSAAVSVGLKHGDILSLVKTLGIAWTFAAFGEEIGYRRYLLSRAAEFLGGSTLAYWIGLVFVSVLFGLGHFYEGTAGMFETACHGFIIGAAYLIARRNLWVAVLAHGFTDTIVFVATFLGVAD